MNEKDNNHHSLEGLDHIKNQAVHVPYWKRMHHTWSFWVFVVLMLAAITYYVMSVDFAFAPHQQMKPPAENHRTL